LNPTRSNEDRTSASLARLSSLMPCNASARIRPRLAKRSDQGSGISCPSARTALRVSESSTARASALATFGPQNYVPTSRQIASASRNTIEALLSAREEAGALSYVSALENYRGAVGHNHLWFYRDAWVASLRWPVSRRTRAFISSAWASKRRAPSCRANCILRVR
jgi:hypothetical protein